MLLMVVASLLALATGLWLSAWWLLLVGVLCYARSVMQVAERYGDYRQLSPDEFKRVDRLVKMGALVNFAVCLVYFAIGWAVGWAFL